MTVPNRIQIKYFVAENSDVDLDLVIPVFHKWIRESAVSGMLIDVADYKHVPDGPGIILVGHDVDYGLELEDGLGLRHTRKVHRVTDVGELATELRESWAAALSAVNHLSTELELTFDTQKVEIRLVDRLNAPNTPDTFAAIQEILTNVAQTIHQQTPTLTYQNDDPRHPLTIIATFAKAIDIAPISTS